MEVGGSRNEAFMRIGIAVALLGFVIIRLSCSGCGSPAPDTQVQDDLRSLVMKVHAYANQHDGLPASFDDLVRPEEGTPRLLEALPRDPWGRPYRLESQARSYTILCDGPDGHPNTGDELRAEGTWAPRPALQRSN